MIPHVRTCLLPLLLAYCSSSYAAACTTPVAGPTDPTVVTKGFGHPAVHGGLPDLVRHFLDADRFQAWVPTAAEISTATGLRKSAHQKGLTRAAVAFCLAMAGRSVGSEVPALVSSTLEIKQFDKHRLDAREALPSALYAIWKRTGSILALDKLLTVWLDGGAGEILADARERAFLEGAAAFSARWYLLPPKGKQAVVSDLAAIMEDSSELSTLVKRGRHSKDIHIFAICRAVLEAP